MWTQSSLLQNGVCYFVCLRLSSIKTRIHVNSNQSSLCICSLIYHLSCWDKHGWKVEKHLCSTEGCSTLWRRRSIRACCTSGYTLNIDVTAGVGHHSQKLHPTGILENKLNLLLSLQYYYPTGFSGDFFCRNPAELVSTSHIDSAGMQPSGTCFCTSSMLLTQLIKLIKHSHQGVFD